MYTNMIEESQSVEDSARLPSIKVSKSVKCMKPLLPPSAKNATKKLMLRDPKYFKAQLHGRQIPPRPLTQQNKK